MSYVKFSACTVVIAWLVLSCQPVLHAETISNKPTKPTKQWVVPRTPDGQPNLQGVWTNVTLTPFERPVELEGKAFFTKEEFPAQEALAEKKMEDVYYPPEGVGTDNAAFFDKDRHLLPTRQTSLVVDPPNGRVPL